MIRYHDLDTKEQAIAYRDEICANGGTAYLLTMNSEWHQVREIRCSCLPSEQEEN